MNKHLSLEERLYRLDDIKATLKQELRFYLSHKDWERVNVRQAALKKADEQKARVLHMIGAAKRH